MSTQLGLAGTSVADFEAAFATNLQCARHIFDVRYGGQLCPKCGRLGKWYPINGCRVFGHPCGRHRSITGKTVLHRSPLPLTTVFYSWLLFCNARSGLPSSFFRRHFGLSQKGSYRLLNRVRLQMALIESLRKIGGPDRLVEVGETLVPRIRTKGKKGAGSVRLVTVTDGDATRSCIIDRAKRSRLLSFLSAAVHPKAKVSTTSRRVFQHFTDYGRLKTEVVFTPDSQKNESATLQGYWMHLKRSLGAVYSHQDRDEVWKYVREFEFRYNRRRAPQLMFWHLVSAFPDADEKAIARCRLTAELTKRSNA